MAQQSEPFTQISDTLANILAGWWVVVLGIIAAVGAAYVAPRFIPPKYHAEAVLWWRLPNSRVASLGDVDLAFDPADESARIHDDLLSTESLQTASEGRYSPAELDDLKDRLRIRYTKAGRLAIECVDTERANPEAIANNLAARAVTRSTETPKNLKNEAARWYRVATAELGRLDKRRRESALAMTTFLKSHPTYARWKAQQETTARTEALETYYAKAEDILVPDAEYAELVTAHRSIAEQVELFEKRSQQLRMHADYLAPETEFVLEVRTPAKRSSEPVARPRKTVMAGTASIVLVPALLIAAGVGSRKRQKKAQ